jgi:hypothetical protein
MTAYRYSPDREKTLETYARQVETDDDSALRAILAECVKRLSKTQ